MQACYLLLAGFAGAAVEHGVDGAGVFLGCGVLLGSGGGGGGLGGHDAALFFDVDGGFLDVGGLEGAEVVGGLETLVPSAAIHSVQVAACARTLHLGGGEEEVDALALVERHLPKEGRHLHRQPRPRPSSQDPRVGWVSTLGKQTTSCAADEKNRTTDGR